MKRLVLVAGMEEASKDDHYTAIVNEDSELLTDMPSICNNPAFLFIFHRYVLALPDDQQAKLLPPLECVMDVHRLAKETTDGPPLAARVLQLHANFLAADAPQALPPKCTSESLRSRIDESLADARRLSEVAPAQLRHLFDPTSDLCIAELERVGLGLFLRSTQYNYVLMLKQKEQEVLSTKAFKAVRLLGTGGFGQVIEVVKRDCGKRYAMKVLNRGRNRTAADEKEWEESSLLERRLLGGLHHPLLVNLAYAFQSSAFITLVMDLCPGNSLGRFISMDGVPRPGAPKLTPEQAHFVGLEVVCIFGYLHSRLVLYRDLKPENLLLDGAGHVRLIDFGLSLLGDDKPPRATDCTGTRPYMAPEVRRIKHPTNKHHRPDYGLEVDWWTLGVLLYELSEHAVPFGMRPVFVSSAESEYRQPKDRSNHLLVDLLKALLK
jgi:tRNA A-37 threonylcarbamoyl transferase component Bud32